MLIILKKGSSIRTVENVRFEDAHKPTVNGRVLSDIQNEGESFQFIESVLWFKTYMVSTIYIDCDKRDIVWYRTDIEPFYLHTDTLLEGCPPNGQRLFEEIDIYDYDPIVDELTDHAIEVMDLIYAGNINKQKFMCEVVRIIHCYILPSLRFSIQDIPRLNKAADHVNSLLELTEKEIVDKGKSVDLSTNNLEKQRHRLIRTESMHVESHVRCCNKEFLSFFLLHIEKEILGLDSQLLQVQQHINKIHDTDSVTSELRQYRLDRDRAFYRLEKLQTVRENIKNVTSRPDKLKRLKKSVKIKQNVFHDIYKELSIRLQEQKEELHKLVLKKLKITTVREAIKNSLKELERGGLSPTSGHPRTSITDGSEYSLDVLGGILRPESWMTIDDKIKNALWTPDGEINLIHRQTVALLIEKTNAALSEMKQFGIRIEFGDDLRGHSRISSLLVEDTLTLTRSSYVNDQNDLVSSLTSIPEAQTLPISAGSESNTDPPHVFDSSVDEHFLTLEKEVDTTLLRVVGESSRTKRSTRTLSQSVSDELADLSTSSLKRSMCDIGQDFRNSIEKMCNLFLTTIPEIEERHFNKLWISYEAILCDKVMKKMFELYTAVYKKPCHTLYKSLVKLSLSEFIIDDKFFKMLMRQSFEDLMDIDNSSVSSSEASLGRSNSDVESSSRKSVSSLEISKCTLEQLYSLADKECESVPDVIHNVLDPHSFANKPRSMSFDSMATYTESEQVLHVGDTHASKTVEECYKEALEKLLSPAVEFIKEAIAAKPLLEKLRWLTKSFRFMNNQLVKISDGESSCCDDMLTITTALILDLDCDLFTGLYATVNLLIDLKAPFLSGGVHDYCLTNFFGAFHYLFDKQVLERREASTC
ncbi:hypothetical protein LOTGIDRAFT_158848 [Lottia gigantea]|uniref:VPS9 domain-containing protein n=1 Tax=Lottia gigantea TaxID=225164 RepID=V4ANY6_LOTGI|nr:hypothetical protein LOTGIDRAFT_158848 [Lottia gigantea]ESO98892.1 hypothetical protein LOTGIDRAFT_158848 [Lottia gigantea]